LNRNYYIRSG